MTNNAHDNDETSSQAVIFATTGSAAKKCSRDNVAP